MFGRSRQNKNQTDIIHCVALYERYRNIANAEIEHQYKLIMMEVQSYYDKKENPAFNLA